MLHNICLSMYLLHNYLNEINFIMKTNFIFCCIYDCPVFLGLLINIDQRVTIINELLKSNECYGKKSGEGASCEWRNLTLEIIYRTGKYEIEF